MSRLAAVKALHTLIWAFFAGCVIAIPVLAWMGRYVYAVVLIGVVLVEVLVLFLNGGRCPLTAVAANFTSDRRENFDIYLPEWLARNNKLIFGVIYFCGVATTWILWTIRKA